MMLFVYYISSDICSKHIWNIRFKTVSANILLELRSSEFWFWHVEFFWIFQHTTEAQQSTVSESAAVSADSVTSTVPATVAVDRAVTDESHAFSIEFSHFPPGKENKLIHSIFDLGIGIHDWKVILWSTFTSVNSVVILLYYCNMITSVIRGHLP